MKQFLIIIIRIYQRIISPGLPATCRFYPSCSEYLVQAMEKRGLWNGLGIGLKRIIRCHPWHPGGYDPVP
ncbi:membrane protein insertion efficiency factor YidD [bacterium]|nr:membrane protein insertion efficiency factor YidD [bacterium]